MAKSTKDYELSVRVKDDSSLEALSPNKLASLVRNHLRTVGYDVTVRAVVKDPVS